MRFCRRVSICDKPEVFTFEVQCDDDVYDDDASELQEAVLGPEQVGTLLADACLSLMKHKENQASSLGQLGQPQEAADMSLEVLELQKTMLGPRHPDTVTTMSNCANPCNQLGQLQEAADMSLEVMESRKIMLGPLHPDTLTAMSNYANRLGRLGQKQEAADVSLQVLELQKTIIGPGHPTTLRTMTNYAYCLQLLGRDEEAAQLRKELRGLKRSRSKSLPLSNHRLVQISHVDVFP